MKKQLLICLLFITAHVWSQTQLGSDIEGLTNDEESGTSVSLSGDGSIVAIGSPLNDNNGTDAGLARVFEFNSNTQMWEQLGNDIFGEAANDKFGHSVSLSDDGSILAVGAPFNGANSEGHVRVYTFNTNTNTWDQLGVDIDGAASGDQSGYSVSLSSDGTILAVGSPFYNIDEGRVFVYSFNSNTNSWEQLGSTDVEPSTAFGRFGYSISLAANGFTLAVGSITTPQGGNVRIYTYDSNTEIWDQRGTRIDGESSSNYFGNSVSLSDDGNTIAAGGPFNSDSGPAAGHVRVFTYNTNISDWEQVGNDIDGQLSAADSGYSVSLSSDGTIVAVGARSYETSDASGQIRLLKYNITSEVWDQLGTDITGEVSSFLGYAVSLSSDASVVAIGSPFLNIGSNPGHVEVYSFDQILSIETSLIQQTKLYPNPAKDQFAINLKENIDLEEILIYNQLGQLVKKSTTKITDIHELSSGLYLITIQTDKGSTHQKLIID